MQWIDVYNGQLCTLDNSVYNGYMYTMRTAFNGQMYTMDKCIQWTTVHNDNCIQHNRQLYTMDTYVPWTTVYIGQPNTMDNRVSTIYYCPCKLSHPSSMSWTSVAVSNLGRFFVSFFYFLSTCHIFCSAEQRYIHSIYCYCYPCNLSQPSSMSWTSVAVSILGRFCLFCFSIF